MKSLVGHPLFGTATALAFLGLDTDTIYGLGSIRESQPERLGAFVQPDGRTGCLARHFGTCNRNPGPARVNV